MDACATRVTTTTRLRSVTLRRVPMWYGAPKSTATMTRTKTQPTYTRTPPAPIATPPPEPEQTPHVDTPPVPSFAIDREDHNPASLEDGYDTDWRYYPEYDPLFQLIPRESRPLTETEEAIRAGYNYGSEKSDHSEDPPHGYTRYVPRTLRGSRAGRVPSLPSPRRCKMIPPIRHRRRGDLPHPRPAAPQ